MLTPVTDNAKPTHFSQIIIITRLHRMHEMQTIATDVCLSVCHAAQPASLCKN